MAEKHRALKFGESRMSKEQFLDMCRREGMDIPTDDDFRIGRVACTSGVFHCDEEIFSRWLIGGDRNPYA